MITLLILTGILSAIGVVAASPIAKASSSRPAGPEHRAEVSALGDIVRSARDEFKARADRLEVQVRVRTRISKPSSRTNLSDPC